MPIVIKPNRNIRKQFLFDEETASKLKFLSVTTYQSENEIVNKAVHAYLARSKFPTLEEMKKEINDVTNSAEEGAAK